jgi:CubicO group peptidase (beta-lactamase class C family)
LSTACTAPKTKPDEKPTVDKQVTSNNGETKREADSQKPGRARDKTESFSAPVPEQWKSVSKEGEIKFSSPGDNVDVHLIRVTSNSTEKAISAAWSKLGIDPPNAMKNQTPPAPDGFDKLQVITYEISGDQVFKQAVARQRGNKVYITLVDGALSEVQKRNSQIKIISSGLNIKGMKEEDLSDKKPEAFDAEKQKSLTQFIKGQIKMFGFPGLSVAVIQGDSVVWSKGFGHRKKENNTKVDANTTMMIGSVTKSMTTMLMAKAVDEGKMTWETRPNELLPKFSLGNSELQEKIRMQHLVCACTGVPRKDYELLLNSDQMTPEKAIESLESFETFTDFGESFQYSNQMVAAGGYVTTAAYGGTWNELGPKYRSLMQTKLFDPMEMTETTIDFDEATNRENMAFPHELSIEGDYRQGSLEHEKFASSVAPAGAVWSSASDMAKYIQTQLGGGKTPNGTRIVAEEPLTKTWQPQIKVQDAMHYGLGWFHRDFKGKTVIQHGGGTLGFTSHVAFVPEDELGIVVLTNGAGVSSASLIGERLFELVYGLPPKSKKEAKFAKKQRTKTVEETRAKLAKKKLAKPAREFVGTYKNKALGQLDVRIEDGTLTVDSGEFVWPFHRIKKSKQKADKAVDVYTATKPPRLIRRLELHRSDSGEPFLRFGRGTMQYDFERTDE